MSSTTKTSPDKIKLLDQMLEDFAGDEFDDFEGQENSKNASFGRFSLDEDMDFFDTTH